MASAEAVLERRPWRLIDVRSPSEYAQDHVPGAVNVPLFDDLERALIGLLYTRASPAAAFEEGRARTLARIAAFSAEIAAACGWDVSLDDLEARVERWTGLGLAGMERALEPVRAEVEERSVVLYCWRGGLRSRSVVAFLSELGRADVLGIEGGYRAYRRCIRARVEAWRAPQGFVLRGLTGVGKTLVLRALEELRPGWTLDLEQLAGHRSSILGMVGLVPASQKLFESRLAERIARGFGARLVVEGESRKIGDLVLPEPVWRVIDCGIALELATDRTRRVRVLLDDYLVSEATRAELALRLPFIEERLGPRWRGELVAMLVGGREAELVEILLERYYDPLYRHSERGRLYVARFDSTDPRAAAAEIARWIERREARAREESASEPAPRALADL